MFITRASRPRFCAGIEICPWQDAVLAVAAVKLWNTEKRHPLTRFFFKKRENSFLNAKNRAIAGENKEIVLLLAVHGFFFCRQGILSALFKTVGRSSHSLLFRRGFVYMNREECCIQ
jgi:hypothetical protein